jgi:protoporphyrinogen oxidase
MLVEQKNKELNNQLIASSFQLGAAIAKEGSKEQFLIQKAASVAQAVIATQTGAAQALALGPIAGPPLAAKVNALGAINVATILATAIKGYQDGGVVPGTSYSGDSVLARVNSAEVIMNRNQQANTLMAIANGGMGSSSRVEALLERLVEATENHAHPINIDGRALASAVRSQVQSGFRLS